MIETAKIGVGVITRRRPQMLQALLESFAQMQWPDGAECIVLIAENDETLTVGPVVDAVADTLGVPVKYALEPEPGIPFARNKVLDMALAEGCNFLTFVDDDETVDVQWLVNLFRAIQSRELDLVGGPITYDPPEGARLTWEQAAVLYEIRRRGQRNADERAAAIGTARETEFGIYTNNWIVRLATQKRLGTRFDESLRYSGGSDTKFYADFSASGARTGWAPDAKVVEIRPLHRLTFRYHFQRCRDQETARRLRTNKPRRKVAALIMLLVGGLRATIYLLIAPFDRLRSGALAARAWGKAIGRLKAAFGVDSRHYDPSTTS